MSAELVGRSLEPVRGILRELVRTPVNFLLVGPTGSGKDQFVRAFHQSSSRSDKPFVSIDCAAIPETLFESQIFGSRKGAFTGADSDGTGIFEAAKGGVVLLNEITDIPLSVQAKLRQVIDEKRFWRVGDPTPRTTDVWIVAATNRTDVLKLCTKNLFRLDLYHRLARVVVHIQPLAERADDIPDLLDHFTRQVSAALGRKSIAFTVSAKRVCLTPRNTCRI